mmetsp:Transcript_7911/g.10890  ORF Transcript_7911/g.10890 Transcript_7911/m.10890 type:complete len:203 (-) Transcript_7911:392-1000(-)
MRSFSSRSKRSALSMFCKGSDQKEPTYTRATSGDDMVLPSDHRRAPYTRISCWRSIWSALLRMHRILSSCPLRTSIVAFSSSEISSLWASKRRIMRSALSANQATTFVKSYPRLSLCFSPERIPGVSTRVTDFRTVDGSWLPSNRLRKETPKRSRPRNGSSGCTERAFPGIVLSSGPLMRTVNLSVVGSGPTLCPGKSLPRR